MGLVYKDFGNNAFEIILCSTDYDQLSEEDIVIPTEESDIEYSIVAHTDMIFPMYKSDNKLNKKFKVSDYTLKQIELLRNDITLEKAEIKFKIGSPIFYRSDKRYYLKLTNLEFVNYYSENSFQKLLLDIPDNVIPFITFETGKNMFDEMQNIKGREKADLFARQSLALLDMNIKLEEYIHQAEDGEHITLSYKSEFLEKVFVA